MQDQAAMVSSLQKELVGASAKVEAEELWFLHSMDDAGFERVKGFVQTTWKFTASSVVAYFVKHGQEKNTDYAFVSSSGGDDSLPV